ncbi:hypothetical protein T4D_15802 [Trichinella pseudospiralis]|uniref:Uncharacterized protein n=1 Tax=Trichinella pseudospiralis TaxID=6337 RepID=A0A0V1G1X8_TRIPS|nr:hypothetical protein T4D_15802 [Trichinella pseudospiralis]
MPCKESPAASGAVSSLKWSSSDSPPTKRELAVSMVIGYGHRVFCFLNMMDVKGEGHLAWVVVDHTMLHCIPDQLVICQEDEISSFMPMLKSDLNLSSGANNVTAHGMKRR